MENNKKLFVLFIFFLPLGMRFVFSQQNSFYTKYRIEFTDRNNSPYSISNPLQFLSPRAIQRRLNQGIAIQQNDLPVNPNYIDSVAKVPNVKILNREKWFNAITIQTNDTNAINAILKYPFVKNSTGVQKHISPSEKNGHKNYTEEYKNKFSFTDNKENSTTQQLNNSTTPSVNSVYNYGLSFNQVNMLGDVCMHDQGFDGKGMEIAILDVGFNHFDSAAAFDSVRTNNQVLGYWNFSTCDSTFYTSPGDVHGTWCFSLMAGNIPGKLIGTAPKAKFWLLVTEYGATENVIEEDNWVSGAEFADSAGADVLSTSLGYTEFDSIKVNNINVVNPANHKRSDMDGKHARISIASAIAASKGMVPVCAAGNSGNSPWHFIGAPADADSTLAVGAVDSLSNPAGFSSRGPSYDGRVKPDVAAQGAKPYTTDLAGGVYNSFSGTSFACPLTAGAVTCLWQAHPNKTNMEIYYAVQQSASIHANPDTVIGYGIPNMCTAHNILLGVNENNLENEIEIFPNPSDGKFQVTSNKYQVSRVEVYNVFGEKVETLTLKGTNTFSLNLPSGTGSGIYFVKIISENGTVTKKLVIE